ncbi:bifunctional helix-turn-helix transcriptional regulator/GNAT family N-acetyltransferase [Thermoactinospora rubra]|uniref:bifunctional helix-turn-helix transcriptional regulator/GNAT family N-acetyltransferase n=1 Tax=Thermoactinospora rubra TaxID=1088767 RepID=UPI000A11D0E8|nr:bifunctional helix-turn-helix transcriptional regulator/GNAT family N-acetyltransferase [Thermoactinospora rubra]
MDVAPVRSFTRIVAHRIGALQDEYLSLGRSLGASRLLWEIGTAGADVRSLRARLDLDSGYLSRLLRSLEQEGLVVVEPDPRDRRVRTARLTPAGLEALREVDHAGDQAARSLLASLNDAQRRTLVEAMGTVERLLTAGLVRVAIEDPRSPAAQHCLQAYYDELATRFEAGFDPGHTRPATAAELTEPAGLFLVARLTEDPIGCGALKLDGDTAEIKRMWVAPAARGLGVGRRLLHELEQHARDRGVTRLRLETNRALREAINLYRSAGFTEVPAFNAEPYAHHWFEKRL